MMPLDESCVTPCGETGCRQRNSMQGGAPGAVERVDTGHRTAKKQGRKNKVKSGEASSNSKQREGVCHGGNGDDSCGWMHAAMH